MTAAREIAYLEFWTRAYLYAVILEPARSPKAQEMADAYEAHRARLFEAYRRTGRQST